MLVAVVAGHGHVVAFKRRRHRQHDIGVLRGRRPEAFGNHHQLRLLPRFDKAVRFLMTGEVRAAGPPDKADIREDARLTVMRVLAARVFQRLDNARHRDFIHRISAAFHAALH